MSIEKKIEEVRRLVQQENKEFALNLAKELISENPNNARLYSLQGFVHFQMRNYEQAILSMTKAISISPQQANLYFDRGCCHFDLGSALEAIQDFSTALEMDNYNDVTFTELLHFYRAESYLKIGKKNEALSDLSYVGNDFRFWTYKLRSKTDLIEDCNKL